MHCSKTSPTAVLHLDSPEALIVHELQQKGALADEVGPGFNARDDSEGPWNEAVAPDVRGSVINRDKRGDFTVPTWSTPSLDAKTLNITIGVYHFPCKLLVVDLAPQCRRTSHRIVTI